ncbi:MAG: type I methionyl aminopeptidase [Chloroflexi bacterium]|nr:type I methionyl aminopeptidase [Chloroflexota bacterium]
MISRKSRREIDQMRRAGRIVAEVLALIESELRSGVTAAHLDQLAERHIRESGATPSFKGYLGGGRYGTGPAAFPASTCISFDAEVVHGIPDGRVVHEGQLVSVDVGAIVDGWHGDAARTFIVGKAAPAARELVEATQMAMMAGIAAAVPGARLADISGAVEDVAVARGYGIVRQFVGHGIGTEMHQDPQIPNYRTGSRGVELQSGMCLAIEPMFTLGDGDVHVLPDGWTVVTSDGSLSAHFEHTIAVTDDGPQILTTIP